MIRLARSARFACALCVAVAALTAMTPEPAVARERRDADEDPAAAKRARGHFQKGEKLFALGKFEEALAEYEAAFDAQPLPEFLFNIGQCHRNLKNYDAAIFSFKKYLRLRPEASNRRAVEKLIEQLEEKVEAQEVRPPVDEQQRVPLVPTDEPVEKPGPSPSRPFYASGWFWAGVVVVGAGVGAAALFWPAGGGPPDSDLGNIDFPR